MTAVRAKRRFDGRLSGGDLAPADERPRPEFTKGTAGDQVALDIEVIVDGGMGSKEPLRRSRRSESAPLAFSAARRLVRNFCAVVRPSAGHMTASQVKIAQSRTVGAKPIGDDGVRQVSLPFQQPAHELEGCPPITPRLHDDIENFALVVDGAPEIVELAADPDEDLVQMPASRRPWPAPSDPCGIDPAEPERPSTHRLVKTSMPRSARRSSTSR